MVRAAVVIDRVPSVKAGLLDASQELKGGIDELVAGLETFAGPPGAPASPMIIQRYEELGALLQLLIWCRMYACELSSLPDLRALAGLVDCDRDWEEFDQVQWVFTGLPALDGMREYAGEVLWNLVIKKVGGRDINGLLGSAQNFKRNLDLFVTRLEGFAQADTLPCADAQDDFLERGF
jgi:hypothetical protein